MIDDINGAKCRPPRHSSNNGSQIHTGHKESSQSMHMNPITGEQYTIQSDRPKPISFMKVNNADKSRRLARILENFNKRDSHNGRSRSNIRNRPNPGVHLHSPINFENPMVENKISSRNQMYGNDSKEKNAPQSFYTSKEIKQVELPSFSQRKLGHNMSTYQAYEDGARQHPAERTRMALKRNDQINNSFVGQSIMNDSKQSNSDR